MQLLTLFFFHFYISNTVDAQSLQHPVIWATMDERDSILELIDQNSWAQELLNDVHEIVDDKVKDHRASPSKILNQIPTIAEDSNIPELEVKTVHQHADILGDAAYAGLLYYLTEEDQYAQFAADILWFYAEELAPRDPQNTSICGNSFYDPRTSYAKFAIAYDFIYNYVKKPAINVYSARRKAKVDYDHATMQKAMLNMVGNTLQEYGHPDTHGRFVSNHPILTGPGALFGILCVEDDAKRDRLFNVLWEEGTAHQNSFKNTLLPMFGNQGIWPESLSYSFMPNITMMLNIIDRVKPEMDVINDQLHILDGNFLFDNLRMPDHRFVTYGDSHRDSDGTSKLYQYTLNLAQRRGLSEYEQKAKVALRQDYDASGGYHPHAGTGTFDNYSAFTQLLWGSPIPEEIEGEIDFHKPTVIVEHAGVALQRNYVEKNNELYGLCGIIGGAHYVHSHVTGITMELYGAGYAMAPNAGLPPSVAQRRIPLHEHYFRLYAGNNTVIVNGSSHGRDKGSWKRKANVWQNTVVNIAAEPAHLADPKNEHFSFATQYLQDEVNNAEQQRTLSTIRTSPTTGYYFDMFRSKSLDENKFHDYIYHNLGDQTTIVADKRGKLKLSPTGKYDNDIGDQVHSPGWRFFENEHTTDAIKDAVNIRYDIKKDKRYMHQFVPGGVEREFTKALAPPSRDVRNGYKEKKTQVVAIRQKGEAWDRPYVVIHEPSIHKKSSIQSVEHLYTGEKIVGAKVTSQVDGRKIEDYIICHDDENQVFELPAIDLRFEGRFAVARITSYEGRSAVELYVGEGKQLEVGDQIAQ
ncbi:heparinase II/III family protein [Echinicola strongylocentroti]|uniref:heparinase II/III family protein n=1 Tax=Echinicola strongylocentroti TaxID=1795355 RepID=UPI0013A6AF2F|nr:heparinase II/III family protein [Echinicola strongylocentroti]